MIITNTIIPPQITQYFNKNLLSTPIFRFDADYIKKIADMIERQILNNEFRKFPGTIGKLIIKHQQFLEIHGRAKVKERENEKEKNSKANALFYRTRLPKQDDRRIFEGLEQKRNNSTKRRRNP